MKKVNSKMSNSEISRFSILSQSSWWIMNKSLTIFLGFDASLLLSDLASKQDYFRDRNQLDEEGYFFNHRKDIAKDTSISEPRQIKAFKILQEKNLVQIKKVNKIPPKFYYKVNASEINSLIEKLHNS